MKDVLRLSGAHATRGAPLTGTLRGARRLAIDLDQSRRPRGAKQDHGLRRSWRIVDPIKQDALNLPAGG